MNWIIIASDAKNQNIKTAQSILAKKGITANAFFVYKDQSEDDLTSLLKVLNQTTHCLIVDRYKLESLPEYAFLLGILKGKEIKTFACTEVLGNLRFENSGVIDQEDASVVCLDHIESFEKYFEENYDELLRKDEKRTSFIDLFTMGIPFTSDCFAQYLAKDNTEICTKFLKAGMAADSKTSDGVPLICVATRNDCFDKVKWLIENGANIDSISKDRGYSAVMDAVWRKNYDIAQYLVSKGARLDFVSSDGQPIMVLAVGNGNQKICQLLLENGADPDIKDSMGMSARGYAALFKKNGINELMDKFPQK